MVGRAGAICQRAHLSLRCCCRSCSRSGFGAFLCALAAQTSIPVHGEMYFNMGLLIAELGQGLTVILQKAGVVLAEDLQSRKPPNVKAAEREHEQCMRPHRHSSHQWSPAKPAGPYPAWPQLPALRLGQAGAAGRGRLLLLAPGACIELARRAAWKQWVIEEVFSQISPDKYIN